MLVNNVGGGAATSVEAADDEWQAAFDWTLASVAADPPGRAHHSARGRGAIVMIASIYGREAGGRLAIRW